LITECLNPTTAQAKEFKLYNRAKHVYSEANRVLRYKEVCESNAEDKAKVCMKCVLFYCFFVKNKGHFPFINISLLSQV